MRAAAEVCEERGWARASVWVIRGIRDMSVWKAQSGCRRAGGWSRGGVQQGEMLAYKALREAGSC